MLIRLSSIVHHARVGGNTTGFPSHLVSLSLRPCPRLQLLVLQLALELLRLGHLADRLVEIVLVDLVPVRLDGE